MNSLAELNNRIVNLPVGKMFTALTTLEHFSIITYAVAHEKLRKLIPSQFDIYPIFLNGKKCGLVSAVTFIDKDFRFKKILPCNKFSFPQTNYRAYMIDKESGESCAWFFETSLGSLLALIPKTVWKMPWFYSQYKTNFGIKDGKYISYKVDIFSRTATANIDILESEDMNSIPDGFKSREEAELILTHPVTGYYLRSDGNLGRYQIWHPKMLIRPGQCSNAYFQIFEELGLLEKEEMKRPYSIFMTNKIEFIIDLPPKNIKIC
jgi:hypothetical protein